MAKTLIESSDLRQNAKNLIAYTSDYEHLSKQIFDLISDIDCKYSYESLQMLSRHIDNEKQRSHAFIQLCLQYAEHLNRMADTYECAEQDLCSFFFSVIDWWDQASPIIEQIANTTGALTGVAAVASSPFIFAKWIRSKLQSKNKENEYKACFKSC